MTFTDAGLKLLKEFEGYAGVAYQDQGGIWTIGYGSTGMVDKNMTITEEQAEARLKTDVAVICSQVEKLLKLPLTDSQYSAVVCFTFNVGSGNLEKSTLLNCINKGRLVDAAEQFTPWQKVNGIPNAGLLRRRLAEKALFQAA